MLNLWDCPFNSPLSGREMWDFYRFCANTCSQAGYWACFNWVLEEPELSDWFMVDMQSQSLQHLRGLQKALHRIPQTNSAFTCCILVKRAYPQRGRSLLLFLSHSSRSRGNSVLFKPEVAGYPQTNKEITTASEELFQCPVSCLAQDQALPAIPPDWRHTWIGRGVCPVSAPVSTSSLSQQYSLPVRSYWALP